ncbi:MAG: hypothetical protein WAJ95_02055, partial [Desulfobacterales bacterium]
VLSGSSDTGGGGGGCFIGISSASGKIGALVKTFFGFQSRHDAVDAAEERGTRSSSELYR